MEFLIIGVIFLVILIFVMRNFNELELFRKICEEPSGYFKFGQLVILFFAVFSFIILLIYNLLNPKTVSNLDVFLTVTVGILGTVIGLFFGAKGEHYISQPRREFMKSHSNKMVEISNTIKNMRNKLKEK